MTVKTEGRHAGEFLVTEANGMISREQITIASGSDLEPGTVLGKVLTGAASAVAAADAGNTAGSGALTLANPATGAGVKAGVYRVVCIEPGTNGGTFVVEDPDGVEIGTAKVGVAYDGVIKFTIADATDFVSGDSFSVTVTKAAGSGKYRALDLTATDGHEVPAGILFGHADALAADARGVAIVRHAEVNGAELVWPDGISSPNKAAAIATLAKLGIIVR
jgi:hypothetical protein